MRKRILHGLLIGALSAVVTLTVWHHGWLRLRRFEALTWDLRQASYARPSPATDQIRLIFLDQASLEWGQTQGWSWPWPREVYTALLAFCSRAGAAAVAFDVIFSEPSAYGVDDDAALGTAIAGCSNFVAAVFVGRETAGRTNWPSELPHPDVRLLQGSAPGRPSPRTSYLLSRAVFPVPEVATNAALLATVQAEPDSDGVFRRLRPCSLFDGQVLPALALAAYLAPRSDRTLTVTPNTLIISDQNKRHPLDPQGTLILRYRGPSQTHRTFNAAAVIESELRLRAGGVPLVDPALFRGKYVFFGFTAPGLFDLKPVPLASVYPGVEVHATALDNLLQGDFAREAPPWLNALLVVACAVLGAVAVRLGQSAIRNVLAFAVFLPLPAVLAWSAYPRGLWLPLVAPLLGSTLAMVSALAVNYAMEGRQKRFIKSAFKQYLSPAVIEELVRHPERLRLGGEMRELSILFSDLQGFTGLSERLDPARLTELLNEYLTAMTDVIYAHHGTVDKYEGDAIIAFWNAPLPQPGHAVLAVRAALAFQERLAELRPRFLAAAGVELRARLGINTGPVIVGNLGSRQRFNYTFLGDAGNLASRLEGLNKQFGTGILISEATYRLLGADCPAREIALVRVVGRNEPVRVFEPLSTTEAAVRLATAEAFQRGLAAFRAGRFADALAVFSTLKGDPAATAYVRRCRHLLSQPPEQWDGVWTVTEK